MKAWLVREKDEFCAEVVFAETRGKAKSLALCTDCCEGAKFTYIETQRIPQADKYYKEGKWHLDWNDPQDRISLVKDCDFTCGYDYIDDCNRCSAKQYCEQYYEQYQNYFESEVDE